MSIHNSLDFFIQWHLTETCNLRCSHCYQVRRQRREMSTSDISTAISEIRETLDVWMDTHSIRLCPSVNLTGGEPFLRDDLYDIISQFFSRNFDVYVLSNGTLIDRDRARRLSDLNVSGVQVSIEGPQRIHESIRGKDSFDASIRGVRSLLEAGLNVTLNVTLSTVNAGAFMDLIRLSSDLGVQRLGFSRLVPTGRGKSMLSSMLQKEEVKNLYERIFSAKTDTLEIVTGDPVASQSRSRQSGEDAGEIALGGCAAGISGLTILPDGTMVPCRRLPVPIGNIMSDSLREVWACSDVLNALRDRSGYKGKCGSCKRWADCRGCRAIAYAYSQTSGEGDLLAPDPQCFIT